jgi:hypothetical protein
MADAWDASDSCTLLLLLSLAEVRRAPRAVRPVRAPPGPGVAERRIGVSVDESLDLLVSETAECAAERLGADSLI